MARRISRIISLPSKAGNKLLSRLTGRARKARPFIPFGGDSMKIQSVKAREILDSRGNPTVEADVVVDGILGRAAVPSGASTGEREALELRDGDKARYLGKGVLNAVKNVNESIGPKLVGMDPAQQKMIDEIMIALDGTPTKAKLGANALLAVSMAVARGAANASKKPLYDYLSFGKGVTLPVPFMNVINGGAHADNTIDFQEFMIVPKRFPSFKESIRAGVEVFHALKSILKKKGCSTNVGDEGGFAPNLKSVDEVLDTLLEAIDKAGYKGRIDLALDVAASELWDKEKKIYVFHKSDGAKKTSAEMVEFYDRLVGKYPI